MATISLVTRIRRAESVRNYWASILFGKAAPFAGYDRETVRARYAEALDACLALEAALIEREPAEAIAA